MRASPVAALHTSMSAAFDDEALRDAIERADRRTHDEPAVWYGRARASSDACSRLYLEARALCVASHHRLVMIQSCSRGRIRPQSRAAFTGVEAGLSLRAPAAGTLLVLVTDASLRASSNSNIVRAVASNDSNSKQGSGAQQRVYGAFKRKFGSALQSSPSLHDRPAGTFAIASEPL